MKVFFLTLLLVGLTFAVAPFKGRRGAGKEMEQLTWTTELLREGELSVGCEFFFSLL